MCNDVTSSVLLCVINLTVSLSKFQLLVPHLLVDLQESNSSVFGSFCTHFPPDVDPVASLSCASSWLILLDERTK